jgi:hypothetical protein
MNREICDVIFGMVWNLMEDSFYVSMFAHVFVRTQICEKSFIPSVYLISLFIDFVISLEWENDSEWRTGT